MGEFDHIKNPAKKAARIGQSFSSAITYKFLTKITNIIENDVISPSGKLYTDGIG